MLSKKMSIYFLASVFGAFSSVSLADTEELILQKLLEKGVISDSEYQEALELKPALRYISVMDSLGLSRSCWQISSIR